MTAPGGSGCVIFTRGTPRLLSIAAPGPGSTLRQPIIARSTEHRPMPGPRRRESRVTGTGHRIDSQARFWPAGAARLPPASREESIMRFKRSLLSPGCRGAPPHVGGAGDRRADRGRDLDLADLWLQRLMGGNGVAAGPGGNADRGRSGAARPAASAQRRQLALFRGRHPLRGRPHRVCRGGSESARPGDRGLGDPSLP